MLLTKLKKIEDIFEILTAVWVLNICLSRIFDYFFMLFLSSQLIMQFFYISSLPA